MDKYAWIEKQKTMGHGSFHTALLECWTLASEHNQEKLENAFPDFFTMKRRKYMFTFESGGWNTVWATSKLEAIEEALEEYKDRDDLKPRVDSFVVATDDGIKSAMSLFY